MPLPALQRDMLSQAINERLAELPRPVPYSRTIRPPAPDHGPLPALVTLLDRARLSPPEVLPSVVAAAARVLDVLAVIYLVDYQQRWLVPLPAADTAHRERLHVDTTLAGRAFRSIEIHSTETAGRARLWVPLRDGDERLGVLEVTLPNPSDLRDPMLRDQLRWLADYVGYLLTSQANYGDALHTIRLDRPRTAGAELVWSLLPPLTASTETFGMAGALEPAASIGGDAFDYALSATTVALAIFDAKGNDLAAGLVVAIALAAYRAARRTGQPLYHQARAIDEAVATQFDDAFLTGVLAELDLTTGRLRYLVAGHPQPLLLRHGKVVKTLTAGRRLPFRLDAYEATIGEETLEPGDWLILHTDGLTDARDGSGALFGQQRLIDFLERAAAGDDPPPETVRRLIHAVLQHQNGVLHDDATVLLARWDAPASAPGQHASGP
jgi:Stage II sporulation protein E (SpoIIE)